MNTQHLYRIDRVKVPTPAREEFLTRVRDIQSFLSTRPGFVGRAIYEHSSNGDSFNFVTVLEWESPEALEAAQSAFEKHIQATGFNPQEFRTRAGIVSDAAIYSQLP
jgi:heme-degrading monooxygenase HmoA